MQKKLKWFTTFGPIVIEEQLLRRGRRGAQLRPFARALEPAGRAEAHLDYAGARAKELPIDSGEVEGGYRHVVQARLKLSGGWWREQSAQAMLQLRVARANHLWDRYWSAAQN